MSNILIRLAGAGTHHLKIAIRIIIASALVAAATQVHAQSSTPSSVKAAEQAATDAANRLDFAAVERFAKIACDGGSVDACYLLLQRYDGGLHYLPNDPRPYRMGETQAQQAADTLQILCDRGKGQECAELARRLRRGVGSKLPKDTARSARLFQKACEMGSKSACSDGGKMYADGETTADANIAKLMLEKACQLGGPSECESLADRYAKGTGLVQDDSAAARLYRLACDGSSTACLASGEFLISGRGAARDITSGLVLLNKACDGLSGTQGVGRACGLLGSAYGDNTIPGVARDAKRAHTYFTRACDLKDALGCYYLGVASADGIGTERDLRQAVMAYTQSCSRSDGIVQSCLDLTEIVVSGEVPQLDLAVARAALLSANQMKPTAEQKIAIKIQTVNVNGRLCDKGDSPSCFIVGQSYTVGDGVPRDPERARAFYLKACDGGFAEGCSSAGVPLIQQGTVPADHARAAALFRRACDGRSPSGCYWLGVVHANGMGVAVDTQTAISFMKQAQALSPSPQLEKRILDALQILEK
ncbi:MAG: SEL1-like repeat protein [Erythrobacter sp.]